MSEYRERVDLDRFELMDDDPDGTLAMYEREFAPRRDNFVGGGAILREWLEGMCPTCPEHRKGLTEEPHGQCFKCWHGCWKCGGVLGRGNPEGDIVTDYYCTVCGVTTFSCPGEQCHCKTYSTRVAA